MRLLRDIDITQKTVGIRVDYNVPLREDGSILDDARIRASIPTLRYALQQQARIVLFSHCGRPKGKRDERYSMRVIAQRVQELLGVPIHFVSDCIGQQAQRARASLHTGEILMLENLRFYSEEEANDSVFAQQLAQDIDVYINDAFGAVHRAHASISAITRCVPLSCAGFLVEKEVMALNRVLNSAQLVVIMGGAKIADKIDTLRRLAHRAQRVCIGGALANTFFAAQGIPVGVSKIDTEGVAFAQEILSDPLIAPKILLPTHVIVARGIDAQSFRTVHIGYDLLLADEMIVDVAQSSVQSILDIASRADALFWNGPLGFFERDIFAAGSRFLAEGIGASAAYTVLGGGDTEACVHAVAPNVRFSHISTGGGASLEYLAGTPLPGLSVLE